jgi:hypothetical protein
MQLSEITGFRISPQQKQLFLSQAKSSFMTQGRLQLLGDLDESHLRTCLVQLIRDHEILRTEYHRLPGTVLPLQVIEEKASLNLEWAPDRMRTRGSRVGGQDPAGSPPTIRLQ